MCLYFYLPSLTHSLTPPFALLPFQKNEEQHYVSGHFSPSASHLGVTVSHADSGMQLEFHKLPLGSWHTQLNQYLDKIEAVKSAGEEGEGSQANVQEVENTTTVALLH